MISNTGRAASKLEINPFPFNDFPELVNYPEDNMWALTTLIAYGKEPQKTAVLVELKHEQSISRFSISCIQNATSLENDAQVFRRTTK